MMFEESYELECPNCKEKVELVMKKGKDSFKLLKP